jgi:benzoyl-CoA reductase/2-hydroxyglutaryl-CoA dehydratase subunit BcrC/BadD/HgdB
MKLCATVDHNLPSPFGRSSPHPNPLPKGKGTNLQNSSNMKPIAYCSPFIPAEWISAHGLRPHWLCPKRAPARPSLAVTRGICPFAGAVIDAALSGIDASALVLTTICDQMRYAAAVIKSRSAYPIFLFNVPSTWQTAEVRRLYHDELERLGRFLVQLGGKSPDNIDLADVMLSYERERFAVCAARDRLSARQYAKALAEARGGEKFKKIGNDTTLTLTLSGYRPEAGRERGYHGIPLAVLGGPMLDSDYDFFDLVERCGGCVALDATEGGERTFPKPFDPAKIKTDPLYELTDAYFRGIPDVFRRPNSELYEWLGHELKARQVRGIIFRRYVWCDLWHAELHRLKQWSALPVLEIDVDTEDADTPGRAEGRIEAFLEMLRKE